MSSYTVIMSKIINEDPPEVCNDLNVDSLLLARIQELLQVPIEVPFQIGLLGFAI